MTRVEFLTQTFSFLQPAARISFFSTLKLFEQRFKDISDKMSVLILPTTDNPNINVHLSVTKSVTLFESEEIEAERALGEDAAKGSRFPRIKITQLCRDLAPANAVLGVPRETWTQKD